MFRTRNLCNGKVGSDSCFPSFVLFRLIQVSKAIEGEKK